MDFAHNTQGWTGPEILTHIEMVNYTVNTSKGNSSSVSEWERTTWIEGIIFLMTQFYFSVSSSNHPAFCVYFFRTKGAISLSFFHWVNSDPKVFLALSFPFLSLWLCSLNPVFLVHFALGTCKPSNSPLFSLFPSTSYFPSILPSTFLFDSSTKVFSPLPLAKCCSRSHFFHHRVSGTIFPLCVSTLWGIYDVYNALFHPCLTVKLLIPYI